MIYDLYHPLREKEGGIKNTEYNGKGLVAGIFNSQNTQEKIDRIEFHEIVVINYLFRQILYRLVLFEQIK